jgi:hypothetical protein
VTPERPREIPQPAVLFERDRERFLKSLIPNPPDPCIRNEYGFCQ